MGTASLGLMPVALFHTPVNTVFVVLGFFFQRWSFCLYKQWRLIADLRVPEKPEMGNDRVSALPVAEETETMWPEKLPFPSLSC